MSAHDGKSSFNGIAAALLVLLCHIGLLPAQISPGPLSKAHASLDSSLRCTSCHIFAAGKPALKCNECHGEIGIRLEKNRGLHAVSMKGKTEEQACAGCHLEHLGRNFALIKWDARKFDHREAGYALEGAHTKLECRQCHQAKFVSEDRRVGIRMRDIGRS
ncbi:MAG: hypothetical protein JNL62_08240, partial [Bryobacterales bacterium]|nr:hypothetical protein [Bryobacterales bacterium]